MAAWPCCHESCLKMFGCIRFGCGSGNHPQLLDLLHGAPAAEKRIEAKRRVNGQRKRKRNSSCNDEAPTKMAHWEEARATKKRRAQAEALEGAKEFTKDRARRWHLEEPGDFDACFQRFLPQDSSAAPPPAKPFAVSWLTMRKLQEHDQRVHQDLRFFHKWTPSHFKRTSHARMNVGIALDIFDFQVARGLRALRASYA